MTMMRGGKRKGAGRPPGAPNKEAQGWPKIGTTISPEAHAWLMAQKAQGHKVNLLIDRAVKMLMAQDQEGGKTE